MILVELSASTPFMVINICNGPPLSAHCDNVPPLLRLQAKAPDSVLVITAVGCVPHCCDVKIIKVVALRANDAPTLQPMPQYHVHLLHNFLHGKHVRGRREHMI